MAYTRGHLDKGRGNVDANTMPEVLVRTGVGLLADRMAAKEQHQFNPKSETQYTESPIMSPLGNGRMRARNTNDESHANEGLRNSKK